MGYQSKTWSLSDEVVAEIERRVQRMVDATGSGSPNRVLREAFWPTHTGTAKTVDARTLTLETKRATPPARELLVELDGDDNG